MYWPATTESLAMDQAWAPLMIKKVKSGMIKNLLSRLRKLTRNEDGVTAMEYGLIAAATVVAIATLLPGVGTKLSSIFSGISAAL